MYLSTVSRLVDSLGECGLSGMADGAAERWGAGREQGAARIRAHFTQATMRL